MFSRSFKVTSSGCRVVAAEEGSLACALQASKPSAAQLNNSCGKRGGLNIGKTSSVVISAGERMRCFFA
jgi:hypothetical protein